MSLKGLQINIELDDVRKKLNHTFKEDDEKINSVMRAISEDRWSDAARELPFAFEWEDTTQGDSFWSGITMGLEAAAPRQLADGVRRAAAYILENPLDNVNS